MTMETEPSAFANLQRRGKSLGLHVQQHKAYDATRGGDLYIQQRKAIYQFESGSSGNPPTILRYATAEQVNQFLGEREQGKQS